MSVELPYFIDPRWLHIVEQLESLAQREPLKPRRKPRRFRDFRAK